jgi:hypothetical protein
MAFDHPLEADKVDDLGLFSTFVRAPVVGFIMWALGGDEAKKREEEEQRKRQVKEQLEGETAESAPSEEKSVPSMQLQQMIEHNRNKKMGKKMFPRMVGSDLSDFGDLATASDSTFCDTDDECDCGDGGGLRRTKKMSWSDESGKDLCEMINEVSKCCHTMVRWALRTNIPGGIFRRRSDVHVALHSVAVIEVAVVPVV